MKIAINIDKLVPAQDELIQKRLKDAKLPTCLGMMIPPLISKIVEFEDSDIFTVAQADPGEAVTAFDCSELIASNTPMPDGIVIKKSGLDTIIKHKEENADKYATQLIACAKCNLQDLCSKLTANYLKALQLISK